MKTSLIFLLISASFSLFAEIPEHCRKDRLKNNQTYTRPVSGPVIALNMVSCYWIEGKDEWGDPKWHLKMVPSYWIPGTKLPHNQRRKIERIISHKIIELKGKDQFNLILSHIVGYISKVDFPIIYNLLMKIGAIQKDTSGANAIVKTALMESLLEMQLRDDKGIRVSSDVEAVIYYGLKMGQDFNVVDKSIDLDSTSKALASTIKQDTTYNQRFEDFSRNLDKLDIDVF
ncbi:MAG: hypothetical protein HOE90_22650 [Bacteriovoracaceae bacterium]|nr:hypothetical protein [Bacteriovoracaceae bacterium]